MWFTTMSAVKGILWNVRYTLYIAFEIDMDGKKDVIGMYVGENEDAKFWLSIINGGKIVGCKTSWLSAWMGWMDFYKQLKWFIWG